MFIFTPVVGLTALHIACMKHMKDDDYESVITALIAAGADYTKGVN